VKLAMRGNAWQRGWHLAARKIYFAQADRVWLTKELNLITIWAPINRFIDFNRKWGTESGLDGGLVDAGNSRFHESVVSGANPEITRARPRFLSVGTPPPRAYLTRDKCRRSRRKILL